MWILVLTSLLTLTSALDCKKELFNCADGQKCIPQEWVCDGVADCLDRSDEAKCRYSFLIPKGTFICHLSKEAVEKQYKCDGEIDCDDGSDEYFCDQVVVANTTAIKSAALWTPEDCLAPKLKCATGQCISRQLVCDGVEDCPSGEDESNCVGSNNSTMKVLLCRDGYALCTSGDACIPDTWICDGSTDCEDGSDEENCAHRDTDAMLVSANVKGTCQMGQFECFPEGGQSKCIPMNRTCDGHVDCPLGDDEDAKCHDCSMKRCEQTCENTPKGAQCICQQGETLAEDGVSCLKDGCKNHPCGHYCQPTMEGFICTCAPGFQLDGTACRLVDDTAKDGFLFISVGSEIRQSPLDKTSSTNGYSTVQKLGRGAAKSIGFINRNSKLFLSRTDGDNGHIDVSDQGLLRTLRENVTGLGYIAVDWTGGNVFFTQRYPAAHTGISVCSMNGFFCKWIIKGRMESKKMVSEQQGYRGLAVHAARGLLVYVDSFERQFKIKMANMDGSNIRILVDTKLGLPSGLTIDYVKSDVYFGDLDKELIEKVNMDTLARSVVVSTGAAHPFAIAHFDNTLYWSDWSSESVKKMTHGSLPTSVHLFSRFPYGLAINHTAYQPMPSSNPCDHMKCPWICVLVNKNVSVEGSCLCPDGYAVRDDGDCEPFPHPSLSQETFISAALMREYCDSGSACHNNGKCKDTMNERGQVVRVSCECDSAYEGDHCERLNPLLAAMQGGEASGVLGMLVFGLVSLAFFLVVVMAYFMNRGFKSYVDWVVSEARVASSPIAAKTKDMKNELKRFVTPQRMRSDSTRGPRVSSNITSSHVLFDPLPLTSTSPSYNNPLFSEGGADGSPIAGTIIEPFIVR